MNTSSRGTGRDARVHQLRLAIRRIETGRVRTVPKGTKLSISSVAREAGLNHATIHTTYPDIAERIRVLVGRDLRSKRDGMVSELRQTHTRELDLRKEVQQLKAELASLGSRHATALVEIEQLRAAAAPAARRLFDTSRMRPPG